MSSFERKFEKAVEDGIFPGAILLARNKTGELNYAKAFGKKSLAQGSEEALRINSVVSIASMTKLLTSVAAMQVVEKGLITLEDDVSSIVPELGTQQILKGFGDSGEPILVDRKNPLKFKYLLTHSSGAVYDMLNPQMVKYRKHVGQPADRSTLETKCGYPLAFEPGTAWQYGTGVDWAGRVVERLAGETLQAYMQKNVFDPLGIKRIAFSPYLTPEMKKDLAGMTVRGGPDGRVVEYTRPWITDGDKDCFGGHGGYADLTDYLKVVESLLRDDEVLLKKATTAVMFSPQLTPDSKEGHKAVTAVPSFAAMFIGDFPRTVEYDWGIGGVMLDDDDTTTKRKRGTMIWSGMPNLFWFIDREAGLCGVFGTQVLPPGDDKVGEMIALFESEMYDRAGVQAKL